MISDTEEEKYNFYEQSLVKNLNWDVKRIEDSWSQTQGAWSISSKYIQIKYFKTHYNNT